MVKTCLPILLLLNLDVNQHAGAANSDLQSSECDVTIVQFPHDETRNKHCKCQALSNAANLPKDAKACAHEWASLTCCCRDRRQGHKLSRLELPVQGRPQGDRAEKDVCVTIRQDTALINPDSCWANSHDLSPANYHILGGMQHQHVRQVVLQSRTSCSCYLLKQGLNASTG